MKIEFIVNAHPDVTRIAVMEDGRLMELIVEKSDEKRIVGNIYMGRVNAVLPGMQAAFVDIGLERSAFLHVSDVRTGVVDARGFSQSLVDEKPLTAEETGRPIEDLIKRGQEVLVQVTKEPIGTKGARVSSRISIAGRYVVSMPGDPVAGVSRKIGDRKERSRLRDIVTKVSSEGFGIIARTAGTDQTEESFKADIERIVERWKEIGALALKSRPPALLHQEHDVVTMTIRDLVSTDMTLFVTDSKDVYTAARGYLKKLSPELAGRIRLFRGRTPIFEHYGIEQEMIGITDREVILKSGGALVIDQTEALVAVDVNTRRYVGRKSQENTILKTNLEAAKEVARQLRLRDIGGIIVIDFIDMDTEDHREKVLNCLRSELGRDRSPTKTCQISSLGLVEMTRKRVRPSLAQSLSEPCSRCGGSGRVLSPLSASIRLERLLERVSVKKAHKNLVISVHPELATYFMEEEGRRFEYLTEKARLNIELHEDHRLRVDEFRVYSLDSHEEITKQFLQ